MKLYAKKETVRKYYKYIYEPWTQPVLTSDNMAVSEGTIVTSASSYYNDNTRPYKSMLGTVVSTVDNNYWMLNGSTANSWLQIKFPYELKISGLSFYTRPRDSYSSKTTLYTNSSKTTQMGNIVSTTLPNTKYTFDFVGQEYITDTIYLFVTNQEAYFGIQNIQIIAQKKVLQESTQDDYDFYKDVEVCKAPLIIEGESPVYTRVEYLESTDNQYIDTGYKPSDTTGLLAKVSFNNVDTEQCMAGTMVTGNGYVVPYVAKNNNIFCRFGNNNPQITKVLQANTPYEISFNYNNDRKAIIDNTQIGSDFTNTYTPSASVGNLYLFRRNFSSPAELKGRIYFCKIDENGTLVRDFIPVIRNSDNVVGMYDMVNDVFYTNAGTGTFIAGPVIEEVEYIESSGTQYIDTGVKQDKLNIHTKLRPLNDNSATFGLLIGARETNNSQVFLIDARNSNNFNCVEYGLTTNSIVGNYYNQDVEIKNEANVFTVNDTQYTLGTYNFTKQYNVYLFSCNQNNSAIVRSQNKARIYFVKMVYNGVLVRDFIPVKVGTEYAMYDKVTGTVYRNAGTGSFTGGNVIISRYTYYASTQGV